MSARRGGLVPAPAMAEWTYKFFLRAYSPNTRSECCDDILATFRDLYVAEVYNAGLVRKVRFWCHTAFSMARDGLTDRADARRASGTRQQRSGPHGSGRDPRDGRTVTILSDLRYAVRTLVRKPVFALTAVGMLALGIGATTTIFSLVDGVLLTALPYPDQHRLMFLGDPAISIPNLNAWRDNATSFDEMVGLWGRDQIATGTGDAEVVPTAWVTRDFFPLFGARPSVGRLLTEDDFTLTPQVTVLSYGGWQRIWGGDRSAVGSTINLDGNPVVIVGVLDRVFEVPEAMTERRPEYWLPLDARAPSLQLPGRLILTVAGRLVGGATVEQAREQMATIAQRLAVEMPQGNTRRDGSPRPIPVVSLLDATVGAVRGPMLAVLGAVTLLLLIACSNVANLLLARGTERERELALRAALGASRSRLAGQVLLESLVIALAGGALGALAAVGGLDAMKAILPSAVPRLDTVHVDLPVLAFALLVSVGTGILFGSAPALRGMRPDLNVALREGSLSATGTRRRMSLRNAILVTEVALTVVLLVGGGLLFNTFVRLMAVDKGFDPDNTLVARVSFGTRPPEGTQKALFASQVLDRVRATPEVRTAAAAVLFPFGAGREGTMCCWAGTVEHPETGASQDWVIANPVTVDYFVTLGAELLRGRFLSESDATGDPLRVVINETLARNIFAGTDGVGQTIRFRELEVMVVGIVADVANFGVTRPGFNNFYLLYEQAPITSEIEFAVRTDLPMSVIGPRLRSIVREANPAYPLQEITTMAARVGQYRAVPKFYTIIAAIFALTSLALALGGVYGSMLYAVGQRTREFGIRMALGARAARVTRMVLRNGLAIGGIGLAVGLAGAVALSRIMESVLFGVTPTDPITYVAVGTVVLGAASVASLVPALKASRADPMTTLRTE